MTDPAPDAVAAIDQMGAVLRSCADALGQYRKGLLDAGFPTDAADDVVQDYASKMHSTLCPHPNPFGGLFGGAK